VSLQIERTEFLFISPVMSRDRWVRKICGLEGKKGKLFFERRGDQMQMLYRLRVDSEIQFLWNDGVRHFGFTFDDAGDDLAASSTAHKVGFHPRRLFG
jgi:hypothetical protein